MQEHWNVCCAGDPTQQGYWAQLRGSSRAGTFTCLLHGSSRAAGCWHHLLRGSFRAWTFTCLLHGCSRAAGYWTQLLRGSFRTGGKFWEVPMRYFPAQQPPSAQNLYLQSTVVLRLLRRSPSPSVCGLTNVSWRNRLPKSFQPVRGLYAF